MSKGRSPHKEKKKAKKHHEEALPAQRHRLPIATADTAAEAHHAAEAVRNLGNTEHPREVKRVP